MLTKITRKEAKQIYEKGIQVCGIPCNHNSSDERFILQFEKDCSFDAVVSYYTKMDCNERDGKHLDFYREGKE